MHRATYCGSQVSWRTLTRDHPGPLGPTNHTQIALSPWNHGTLHFRSWCYPKCSVRVLTNSGSHSMSAGPGAAITTSPQALRIPKASSGQPCCFPRLLVGKTPSMFGAWAFQNSVGLSTAGTDLIKKQRLFQRSSFYAAILPRDPKPCLWDSLWQQHLIFISSLGAPMNYFIDDTWVLFGPRT